MDLTDVLDDGGKQITDTGERFLNANKKYYQLKIFQQLTLGASSVGKLLLIGTLASVGLVFLSVSLALVLGTYFGNDHLGFLFVGLLYILLAIIAYLLRKRVDQAVIKKLSKTYFD